MRRIGNKNFYDTVDVDFWEKCRCMMTEHFNFCKNFYRKPILGVSSGNKYERKYFTRVGNTRANIKTDF